MIERDEHGNARGGIRTPFVDVPISALSGEPVPGGPPLCRSFGSTTPLDAATLARLYPTTTPTWRPSPRRPRLRSTPVSSSGPKPTR